MLDVCVSSYIRSSDCTGIGYLGIGLLTYEKFGLTDSRKEGPTTMDIPGIR